MLNSASIMQRASQASLLVLATCILSSPAWAQAEPVAEPDQPISPQGEVAPANEKAGPDIVVTGTLFRQAPNQSQLVTTITGEDLAERGVTSATEALAAVATNQPLTVSQTTAASGTGFASFANLRSLGSANTLVLLNGKRVVANPFQASGVDLNTIPVNLIERVETLSDGASSIYGSDAVAGVINFITLDTLQGVRFSGNTQVSEAGGGERYSVGLAAGIGDLADQGWNFYVAGSYRKQQELLQLERDFSATYFLPEIGVNRLNASTFPANYSQGVINANPSRTAGCAPPFSIPNGAALCGADAAVYTQNILPEQDYSAVVHGTAQLGGIKLSADYFWARATLLSRIAPQSLTNLTVCPRATTAPPPTGCNNTGALNPFFPGNGIYPAAPGLNLNAGVTVSIRPTILGPLTVSPKTDTDRALLQLDGEIAENWNWSVWGLRSTSTARLRFVSGVFNYNALRDGFAGRNGAPFLNAFGDQTPAGLAFIQANELTGEMQRAESELWMGGAQIAGSLFDLPAGPVQLAFAGDYRDDSVKFTVNPQIAFSVGTGLDTARDASGDRQAYSLTSELKVPLLEMLTIDAALRYDHYSDFGSTLNPKILATLRPAEFVELHGSYNTGFRAPTLYNLFSPVTYPISRNRQNDPVLCPSGTVATGGVASRDCNIQFPNQNGGNPALDAETSDAYALGATFKPLSGLRVQVDYWNYTLSNTIAQLNESVIFANPTKYADLIVRCADVTNPSSLGLTNCNNATGNPIAYVIQTLLNLGNTKTSGFDLKVNWSSPEWSLGQIRLSYNGTLVDKFKFQREPDGPYFSRRGAYLDGSVVNKYNHYATLSWEKGKVTTLITNRYAAGYTDCNAQCIGATTAAQALYRDVDHYSLWDVGITLKVNDDFSLTGRIANVFDTDPPLTNKTQGIGTGYDERYTDTVGRSFSIGVRASF